MGNLYDYFRAPDDDTVVELLERNDGELLDSEGKTALAQVADLKAFDPDVIVGQLVSLVLDVDWDPDLVDSQLVWPSMEQADDIDQGAWTVRLSDEARDAIAGIDDGQVTNLAQRWSQVEELADYSDMSAETVREPLTVLVGLARNAKAADEHLYCWMSL